MMIVSLIKKSKQDNAVTRYMNDIDNIRRMEYHYRETPQRPAANVNFKPPVARDAAAAPLEQGRPQTFDHATGGQQQEVATRVQQLGLSRSAETVVNIGAEWDVQKNKVEGQHPLGILVEEKEEGVRV